MTNSTDDDLLRQLNRSMDQEAERLGASVETLDLLFLVYLRRYARLGYFTYGPVTIDVRAVERVVTENIPKGPLESPAWSDDLVLFYPRLMEEVHRSGWRHLDEVHFLLAFMRTEEGLPGGVFSELDVTREQVEDFTRTGRIAGPDMEKLYTPEGAAEFLEVHVETVRTWIRSGRLRASRLAGQRALRITASDLQAVLKPLTAERHAAPDDHPSG